MVKDLETLQNTALNMALYLHLMLIPNAHPISVILVSLSDTVRPSKCLRGSWPRLTYSTNHKMFLHTMLIF